MPLSKARVRGQLYAVTDPLEDVHLFFRFRLLGHDVSSNKQNNKTRRRAAQMTIKMKMKVGGWSSERPRRQHEAATGCTLAIRQMGKAVRQDV